MTLKLKETKESQLVEFQGEGATQILEKAFRHITTSKSKKQLTKDMVEILVKEGGSSTLKQFNKAELQSFSQRVCELIHNE